MVKRAPKRTTINQRIETAVFAYFEGNTKSDAYREAYPKSKKWTNASVHAKASEFFKRDKVLIRLAQLQKQAAERNAETVDDLIIEFEENRQAALTAETPQITAANQATTGKAKLLGLSLEKINLTVEEPITKIIRTILPASNESNT